MPTNLLNLPNVEVAFQVATNESWRDDVAFVTTGAVVGYPASTNTGGGNFTGLSATQGAGIGSYSLVLSGPVTFQVADPSGAVVGTGTVQVPFSGGGLNFTLVQGSPLFTTGDAFTIIVQPAPIDLTGIRFVMQVRKAPGQAQIDIAGDTADDTLVNGGTNGVVSIAIPFSTMQAVAPSGTGAPYVFDMIGLADGDQRRCMSGTCTVVAGITQVPAASS